MPEPCTRLLFVGKNPTAALLTADAFAKAVDRDLHRVQFGPLVSKYIGETEKNLARVFETAEAAGAVLFFDEADALFGRRTKVKDSHDRYANHEVAYLLNLSERFPGTVIIGIRPETQPDDSFVRRCHSVIRLRP